MAECSTDVVGVVRVGRAVADRMLEMSVAHEAEKKEQHVWRITPVVIRVGNIFLELIKNYLKLLLTRFFAPIFVTIKNSPLNIKRAVGFLDIYFNLRLVWAFC